MHPRLFGSQAEQSTHAMLRLGFKVSLIDINAVFLLVDTVATSTSASMCPAPGRGGRVFFIGKRHTSFACLKQGLCPVFRC
jgi:hypothetical protein